ncbi:MAG: hypothetical protein K8F60_18575 [Melioribacteraceae bacterium]|nr:hypothetical protein [Melioribacteraceae bacterium]
MNQEITISPDLIGFIKSNFPIGLEVTKAQEIVKYVKENYVVADADFEIRRKMFEQISTIEDPYIKSNLLNLINHWYEHRFVKLDSKLNTIEELSALSLDKILLDVNATNKKIDKDLIKYAIETHNDQTFLSPKTFQKLKHSNCDLIFEKDIPYNIAEILRPFLRKPEYIEIRDPFLMNENALHNLKSMIEDSECNKYIFRILPKHIYRKYRIDGDLRCEKFEQYINSLKSKGLKIRVENYNESGHKERYIYTNQVRIKLPGGLDFLDREGKITTEDDVVFIEIRKNSKL